MDFANKLQEIRAKNFTDIEIAEELSKMSGRKVSRQRVYNYRIGARANPAIFEVAMAILKLHKRIVTEGKDDKPATD